MKFSSSFPVISSCNQFFSQNGFRSEMFYQNLLYLRKHTSLFIPSPLVYGFYACEKMLIIVNDF